VVEEALRKVEVGRKWRKGSNSLFSMRFYNKLAWYFFSIK